MFVANDGAGILKRFEWVVVVVVGGGSPGSFLWSGIVHGLLMVEVKKIVETVNVRSLRFKGGKR